MHDSASDVGRRPIQPAVLMVIIVIMPALTKSVFHSFCRRATLFSPTTTTNANS